MNTPLEQQVADLDARTESAKRKRQSIILRAKLIQAENINSEHKGRQAMNTTTNGHVRFYAYVQFEIPIDEAADILSLPQDERRNVLATALRKYHPVCERTVSDDDLAKALGETLAVKLVEERRMLTAPKDVAVPIN